MLPLPVLLVPQVLKIILDLERLERLLEYDSEKSKLRPPGPNLLSPSSPKAGSRRSLQEANSAGGSALGSQPGSLGSSLANSRAPSPAMGSRTAKGSAGGAGHAHAGGRKQTPDGDVQAHVVHNRQLYCAECAGIMEDMCPFTPGAGGPIASAPSWSQWQQQRQRRANSPSGPAAEGSDTGSQQQAQQQDRQSMPSPFEAQQEPSSPSVGCAPQRCEVCGKRLRASTTPDGSGLSTPAGTAPPSGTAAQGGAPAATAAAAAAPAGADAGDGAAARSSRPAPTSIVGAIAGMLPASITAALQSVSSGGSGGQQQAPAATDQQQAQQFDAVAAAAADFDAAGSRGGSAQPAEQWTRWQGVVSAVRGAHGTQQQQPQQQLQHAGGSSNSLLDASLAEGCSTPGPEVRGTQCAQASTAS